MPMLSAPVNFQPVCEHNPEQEILSLSEQILRMLMIARALANCARPIDLNGLQEQVGLLCAKALDLPPKQTGFVKLELCRLIKGLDDLKHSMRNEFA